MKSVFTIIICVFCVFSTQAQIFDRLANSATNSADRALNRKVEQKAQKETDKAFDSVFEGDGTKKSKSSKKEKSTTTSKSPESVYNFTHKYVMQMESDTYNTTFTYYLAKDKNYFGNTIENASTMFNVMDLDKKTMFMFTEAGGNKMLMSTSLDVNDFVDETDASNNDVKIEKTNNTKVILNYTCREYKISSEDYNGSVWVTKEADISFPRAFYNIDAKKNQANQEWMKQVDGLMLEMNMTVTSKKKPQTLKMTCVALDETSFSINTKDYKKLM
ncbi:DUF4412 domain-containing protein [Xanthomarina sp. F2636L]|uniref:DUF4412 domain-containing protein n=1 Tax=Xanthomarina sp. F2636L TaxID=2996018 RepID=UPI00225E329D|nr:DUF4412 domain-containing protein [Xanthomarina sp. F2636L]MCX7551852.1 DUF4412 domain-containing protein [Xanthomarina sp. F2636L]